MASCLTCVHWQPKQSGPIARHGYAICAHMPKWTFFAPSETCERHKSAAPEVIEARLKWEAKRNETHLANAGSRHV